MKPPELRQLVQRALPQPPPVAAVGLAQVPAGAAETLLWLQPPADAAQMARAQLARSGRFEAQGEVHALPQPPRWAPPAGARTPWLAAAQQLPMLPDLALAWSARRAPEDLAAWARVAESWLSGLRTGQLGDDGQVEAERVTHAVISLLVLRAGDAVAQLPATLLPRLLERIAHEVDHILRHLQPAGGARTRQLYAVYLATTVLGPCLPRRGRSLAAAQAAQARELLVANLLQDFGAGGVHCAHVPREHQRTLHTALCFVALARALDHALPPALHRRLREALEFSLWSTLPDGGLPGSRDAQAASNQPLLALGAALYWLPSLEFAASGGGRGEPPDALARRFGDAGCVIARDGWHEAQAQHLFHPGAAPAASHPAAGDALAFGYAIAGRQVVVPDGPNADGTRPQPAAPLSPASWVRGAGLNALSLDSVVRALPGARAVAGLQRPPAAALPALPPLVRLGARSVVLRTSVAGNGDATLHMRCLVYVLRRYVLVVDRVQAPDHRVREACFTLRFAAGWDDRIALEQDAHGTRLRGVATQPSGDWQVLLDAPSARITLESEGAGPAPCLHARQDYRGESFLAAAIGPQGSGFAIDRLEARHGAGRSVLCVHGEHEGEPFVDRLVVHWHEPGLVLRADYMARAGIVLERRGDGRLQHLLLAQATDWFSRLQPVHASRTPDAAGDLEW